jgi:hypothetical protein
MRYLFFTSTCLKLFKLHQTNHQKIIADKFILFLNFKFRHRKFLYIFT